jgi:beta-lactamase regulating signal transducer with metallopeptidase domain
MLELGLRRCSAKARYLAGCLTLVLMLAVPVATFVVGEAAARQGLSASAFSPIGAETVLPITSAGNPEDTHVLPGIVSLAEGGLAWLARVAPLLPPAWLMGVIVCSCRLAGGYFCVRRMHGAFQEHPEPGWVEILEDLRCRLEISRPVRIVKSVLVRVPTVIGCFRPVILLPAAAVTGLTPEQLQAILAHELAHIRRWDHLVSAGQCLVETLLFYHPVVWWISRKVREEREICCDDLAVTISGDSVGYARALASLEEARAGLPGLAFAATGGSLLKRIRRLLGLPTDDAPATRRQVAGLALIGLGLLVMTLGVYTLLRPTTSQPAVARIKVERDQANITELTGTNRQFIMYDAYYNPYLIQTEFEVIQSEVILSNVITALDLRKKWGKKRGGAEELRMQEALALLKARIDLRPIRNTSLIDIRVFNEDSQEAATIANTIAQAYVDYRLNQQLQASRSGIRALEERLRSAQEEVDRLREELKIPDTFASDPEPLVVMTAETLRRIEAMRIENQYECVRTETLLKTIKELSPEQRIEALTTAVEDPVLSSLLTQATLVEQSLIAVKKDYGPENPAVAKANEQFEDLRRKITGRAEDLILGLEIKVEALKQGFVNLEGEVRKAKDADVQRGVKSRPYFAAKRKLEELQRFAVLNLKIGTEAGDIDFAKRISVTPVEMAVPQIGALSPNRAHGTALTALGALLEIGGAVLLAMSRRTTKAR